MQGTPPSGPKMEAVPNSSFWTPEANSRQEAVTKAEPKAPPLYIGGVKVKAPPQLVTTPEGVFSVAEFERMRTEKAASEELKSPPEKRSNIYDDAGASSSSDIGKPFTLQVKAAPKEFDNSPPIVHEEPAIVEPTKFHDPWDFPSTPVDLPEPVVVLEVPPTADFKSAPEFKPVQTSTLGKMLPTPSFVQLEALQESALVIYQKEYINAMIIYFLPRLQAEIQFAMRLQSKAGVKNLRRTHDGALERELHDNLSEFLIQNKAEFIARYGSSAPVPGLLAIEDEAVLNTEELWATWNSTMRRTFTERWLGGPEGRLNPQKGSSSVLGFVERTPPNKI
jgi:hypothetical protein